MPKLVFLFGPPAVGKLTIARELAARTGLALFHNHLVVDTLLAVFPFGSEPFVRLREQFWLAVLADAARDGVSLIFTFAPEPTVAPDFPARARAIFGSNGGGAVHFVRLEVSPEVQEARLGAEDRTRFGKLTSLDVLRQIRAGHEASMAAMPAPEIVIDTGSLAPNESAIRIAHACGLALTAA